MHRRGLFFFIALTIALCVPYVTASESLYGSNWDRSCNSASCTMSLYSYDKYWPLSNGSWVEIDEQFHDCSASRVTRFCSNRYYYSASIDSDGNVTISSNVNNLSMRLIDFNGGDPDFSRLSQDANNVQYNSILPDVDLKYYYMPKMFKEEVIVNSPPSLVDSLNVSFSLAGDGFILAPSIVCDSNETCFYPESHFSNGILTISIPSYFFDSSKRVYPIIIDPTIILDSSSILWNGQVNNVSNSSGQFFIRTSNPASSLLVGSAVAPIQEGETASSFFRAGIDWNVSSIPDSARINTVIFQTFLTSSLLGSVNVSLNVSAMDGGNSSYADNVSYCAGNCNFYIDMANGSLYSSGIYPTLSYLNISLSSQAARDLQSGLGNDRFSLGFDGYYQSAKEVRIASKDATNSSRRPKLVVNYTYDVHNLTWDSNGNLQQGFGKYLEYDGWHHISKVRNENATGVILEEYSYDQQGTRIKKITYSIDSQGNNRTTYYISDEFIQERITNGTILNYTYYYLNDKLLSMKSPSGEKFYYHPDHLGSTTLVTNQSGDVVDYIVYKPFGEIHNGEADSRFLFTGQELDQGTNFYYYGARYYDPKFSHFIQPDPVIADLYDPQNLNKYSYVLNNPYKYTDPTGNYVELVTRSLNNPYPYDGNNLIKQGLSAIAASLAQHFTHSYFDVTPDNPKDFGGETNFQLGAYASSGNIFKGGTLTYEKNGEGGKNVEYSRVLLNTPEGKTDTEFINDLMAGGNRLNSADVPYSIIPLVGGKGANSNTFARTAVDNAKSSLSSGTYEGLAPGPAFITSPGLNKEYNFDTQKIENANKNSPYQRFKNFFSTSRNSRNRK